MKEEDITLEIQIKLEEISKKLKMGSLNIINILSPYPLIYEYTSDYYSFKSNPQKFGHYEKISFLVNNTIEFNCIDVIDNCWPHYTPEKLIFDNIEDAIIFLEDRYLKNSWLIDKLRKKRYLINDGIDDIPKKYR